MKAKTCEEKVLQLLETEEQKTFLKEIGCDLGQGFLFHKPEPLEAFIQRKNGGADARTCETPEERAAFRKDL